MRHSFSDALRAVSRARAPSDTAADGSAGTPPPRLQILLYVRGGDAWASQSWSRAALGDGLSAGLALCLLLYAVAMVQASAPRHVHSARHSDTYGVLFLRTQP